MGGRQGEDYGGKEQEVKSLSNQTFSWLFLPGLPVRSASKQSNHKAIDGKIIFFFVFDFCASFFLNILF